MPAPFTPTAFGSRCALAGLALLASAALAAAPAAQPHGAPTLVNGKTCNNPAALGTSRTLAVDTTGGGLYGLLQYKQTVALEPGEVILTFDDGPLPPYTDHVLEALDQECVKATFFFVGVMVKNFPDRVRLIAENGHTIANHTQRHRLPFDKLAVAEATDEIIRGFSALQRALGFDAPIAPFFRFPGLGRSKAMEDYLAENDIAAFSIDVSGDDWTPITGDEVRKRVMDRLRQRGKGIILLHDIQARTAVMLPDLLRDLKAGGYKVVHMTASALPATGALLSKAPAGEPEPEGPAQPVSGTWPKIAPPASRPLTPATVVAPTPKPAPPRTVVAPGPATGIDRPTPPDSAKPAPATRAPASAAPRPPTPPRVKQTVPPEAPTASTGRTVTQYYHLDGSGRTYSVITRPAGEAPAERTLMDRVQEVWDGSASR